jgi:uncharacterized protein YndB with AHSA1/START domain
MADIIHRVGVKAPRSKVYDALSTIDGLAGWWTTETSGHSKVGEVIGFQFHSESGDEIGGFEMDVVELVADEKIRWRVSAGPAEWLGTDVEFSLSQQDDYTASCCSATGSGARRSSSWPIAAPSGRRSS